MTQLRTAAVVILLLGQATLAAAQDPATATLASTLVSGTRVRVKTTSMSIPARGVEAKSADSLTVVGVVHSVDAGALTLVAGRDTVKVPLSAINTIDVSVGRKNNWRNGLLIGLASGVVLGLTAPVDKQNCGDTSQNFCSRGEPLAAGTVLLGGVGVIIGAFKKTDRWERRFTRSMSADDVSSAPVRLPHAPALLGRNVIERQVRFTRRE